MRRLDDERTRRSVLWLLLQLGATAVIALVVWLLLGVLPSSPPPAPVAPPRPPVRDKP